MAILSALFNNRDPKGNILKAPSTATSISNKDTLPFIRKAVGQGAIAVSAPIVATSGAVSTLSRAAAPIVAQTAKSAGTSVLNFIKANPIKSAVGGLIGFGAVRENPKLITEIPSKTSSGLVNVGANIGKFTEEPSVSSALDIYKQNPFIAGGLTAAGLGLSAAAIAPTISSISQTQAIREQTAAITSATSGLTSGSDLGSGLINDKAITTLPYVPPLAASSTYPDPNTQLTSYTNREPTTYKKRKKSKTINRSAINIRNNILIANRN